MLQILLSAGLLASGAALACADVRDVPLTPDRNAHYEKMREEVRGNVEKARREKNPVDLDLAKAELTRIEMILGSGREQIVQPAAKAPKAVSSKCAG